MSSAVKRPPITCHVLNTVTGLPAASLPVTLTLIKPYGPSSSLTALTDSNGRVERWNAPDDASGPSLEEVFFASSAGSSAAWHETEARNEVAIADTARNEPSGGQVGTEGGMGTTKEGEMVWALRFDVSKYFGGEGFWEVVEVRFRVLLEEGSSGHWHVPLLLSPWSYTTYRGS